MASSTTERVSAGSPEALRVTFSSIAAGELDRELTDRPPYDEVRQLADAGFGLLRLPRGLGGSDRSVAEVVDLVVELAAADPGVAHVWRNHFLFTEGVRAAPELFAQWLPELRAGKVFGLGFGETAMPRAGESDFGTRLTRDAGGWVLDGVKHYSTGNLYADHIVVQTGFADGSVGQAIVPRERAGVEVRDDWDGIGQRFTGSGTTVFERVRVADDEVITAEQLAHALPDRSTPLAQVWLTAVVAGVAVGAARASVELVRARRRNFFHGLDEDPRHDALVQAKVGELSAQAFAARATVLEAARSLDAALADGTEPAMEEAALDAARAKIAIDALATSTTAGLLDTGSASAIRRGSAYDRFWRNARAVIAHNPSSYKQRIVGDHLLNGTPPPKGSFF